MIDYKLVKHSDHFCFLSFMCCFSVLSTPYQVRPFPLLLSFEHYGHGLLFHATYPRGPPPPSTPPHHHHHSVSYSERAIKSVCVCICICQKSALIFTITVLPLSPVPYLFSFWHQALFSSILHQVVPKAGLHFPFIFFPHITLIWHGKKITSVFFFFLLKPCEII